MRTQVNTNRRLASRLDGQLTRYSASMDYLKEELANARQSLADIEENMSTVVDEKPESERSPQEQGKCSRTPGGPIIFTSQARK